MEVLLGELIPLGFSATSKGIMHNVATVIKKIFDFERLNMFEDNEFYVVFNLIVTLLNFWVADICHNDNYLMTLVIDILETLTKSSINIDISNFLIKVYFAKE